MPLDWIENSDEKRNAAELAELVVGNALNTLQDAVSEAQREPWPPLFVDGKPRAMAPSQTRCDGVLIHLWYGLSEQAPVIAFDPIALNDIVHPA